MKRLCETRQVARSSFYAWLAAAPARAARAGADAALAERIRTIHDPGHHLRRAADHRRAQRRRSTRQRVNHKRVARVMREHAIAGLRLTPPGPHHDPRAGRPAVPDLLGRDFTAEAPNQRYVGDITYLPIADGRTCTWPP